MKKICLAAVALLIAQAANATIVGFTWTGAGGYNANGSFSYASALDGTGVITSSSLTNFHVDAYQGSNPLFSWNQSDGTAEGYFQFSFDTTAFDIVKGGYYPTASDSVMLGFSEIAGRLACGNAFCGIFTNGAFDGYRPVTDQQFTFARQPDGTVPEPTPLALLGLGIAAAGMARRVARRA